MHVLEWQHPQEESKYPLPFTPSPLGAKCGFPGSQPTCKAYL